MITEPWKALFQYRPRVSWVWMSGETRSSAKASVFDAPSRRWPGVIREFQKNRPSRSPPLQPVRLKEVEPAEPAMLP